MFEPYFVTFADHREASRFREVELLFDNAIQELLKIKEFVEFYVGFDGDFDTMTVSAICLERKLYGEHNCAVNLVLPYPNSKMTCFYCRNVI